MLVSNPVSIKEMENGYPHLSDGSGHRVPLCTPHVRTTDWFIIVTMLNMFMRKSDRDGQLISIKDVRYTNTPHAMDSSPVQHLLKANAVIVNGLEDPNSTLMMFQPLSEIWRKLLSMILIDFHDESLIRSLPIMYASSRQLPSSPSKPRCPTLICIRSRKRYTGASATPSHQANKHPRMSDRLRGVSEHTEGPHGLSQDRGASPRRGREGIWSTREKTEGDQYGVGQMMSIKDIRYTNTAPQERFAARQMV